MNNPISENSTQLFLSLIRDSLPHSFNSAITPLPHRIANSHCAVWLQFGEISVNHERLTTGHGAELNNTDSVVTSREESAVMLRFIVSTEALQTKETEVSKLFTSEIIFTQSVNVQADEMLLRLDQVDFPPAAVAYKHTHPGPGIRYLVAGGLTLVSDHDKQTIESGKAWFEDANSAVEATAINTAPSRFVRTMLLPLEYEGRSTFTLCKPGDEDKPKLQINTRYFEKRIVTANRY